MLHPIVLHASILLPTSVQQELMMGESNTPASVLLLPRGCDVNKLDTTCSSSSCRERELDLAS
jgi:hypothetical protein